MVRFYRDNSDNLISYTESELYDMVRNGTLRRFDRGYWTGINAKDNAREITKHLFEDILKWSIDDIKNCSLREVFFDNRLGGMVNSTFDGSVFDAIINAYPELGEYYGQSEVKNKIEREEKDRIQYSDEELIENIKNKTKELNRPPFAREMENPDGNIYTVRFKGWEKALIAAGVVEDIYKDIVYSVEEKKTIETIFKDFVLDNERFPNMDEVLDTISKGELKTYFRSYSGLCEYLESNYSKDELIKILKNKYKKLERIPVGKDMILPRAIVFIDKFGSWNNALIEAGLVD